MRKTASQIADRVLHKCAAITKEGLILIIPTKAPPKLLPKDEESVREKAPFRVLGGGLLGGVLGGGLGALAAKSLGIERGEGALAGGGLGAALGMLPGSIMAHKERKKKWEDYGLTDDPESHFWQDKKYFRPSKDLSMGDIAHILGQHENVRGDFTPAQKKWLKANTSYLS